MNEINNDDKELLEIIENDLIEEDKAMLGIVSQDENLLAYSIKGVYLDDKETKYVTGKKLKENPPILKISSGDGSEVEFLLTKEFTRMLSKSLEEVNKCYSGYKYVTSEEMTFKEKIGNLPLWFKKKPLEVVFTALTIFLIFYVIIRGNIG